MKSFLLVVLYVLIAPPLGGLIYWAIAFLPLFGSALLDGGWDDRWPDVMAKMALMHVVFSYALGVIPALGTAIGHALLLRRTFTRRVRVIVVGLLGLCLTSGVLSTASWALVRDLALPLVLAGTFTAALLAWTFERVVIGHRGFTASPADAGA